MSPGQKRAAAVAAIVVGLVLVWEEILEDRVVPKRWGEVEAGSIYRSGQLHPALVESTLVDHEIDVIVNMNRWALDKVSQATQESVAEALGITKERYPMLGDGTGDPEMYVQAVARVHKATLAGERVLVHCTAGAQRTGGVIALYRLLVQGWPVEAVLAEMERYDFDRVDDEPMLRFIDNNMTYISRRLVELEVLPELPDPLPSLS